jgi:hypothetical protein
VEHSNDLLLMFVGGGVVITGTCTTPPPRYSSAIFALLRSMEDVEWQRWWSESGQPPCELYAWMGGPRTEVRVRRTARKVTAQTERAVADDDPDPGLEAAVADVDALLSKLRKRFDLADTPAVHSFTASERRRWGARRTPSR